MQHKPNVYTTIVWGDIEIQRDDDVVKEQFYEAFTDNFLQKRLMEQVDAQ
jgi:hypothetical protein